MNFKGKKILVTGAGSGIGKDLCIALVKNGAAVFGLSKTWAHLEALKKECPEVHIICQDLTDWEGTKKALEGLPTMNGLVNNAAIAGLGTFLEVTEDKLDRLFAVNTKPAVNMTQIVAKQMLAQNSPGSVVNVSSILSVVPLKCHPAVPNAVAKAGLDQLTRCMALELGPHQIRVNSVNPTLTMTPMAKMACTDPAMVAALKDRTPLGRFAETSDVVGVIMFLLSDLSEMINGVVLPIDGGFLSSG